MAGKFMQASLKAIGRRESAGMELWVASRQPDGVSSRIGSFIR